TCYFGRAKPGFGAPEEVSLPPSIRVRPVTNLYWPGSQYRVMWQVGVGKLLRGRHDVIVCPEVVHNLAVWWVVLLHGLFGKRLVLFGHGYRPVQASRGLPGALRKWARRLLLGRARAVIAYTERGREECLDLGVPAEAVFVCRNTMDIHRLRALETRVDEASLRRLREELGTDDQRLVVLFLGKIRRRKRLDVLLEGARLVHDSGTPITVMVIGDGPERAAAQAAAGEVPWLHFLGAIYDEAELAPYFLVADVLVLPGALGLTCVHGFAHGVPTVTSSDRALLQTPEYDYLVDGHNGLIVASAEPGDYADLLRRLASDRSRVSALKAGARASGDEMGIDLMAERFAEAVKHGGGMR
ncbi:MAG: glycosyltransferase family 4 protein, partial [Acidimicrobiia bacterium]